MRTWPPGVSWYSSESAQLMASGTQRGTVTAMAPPGRSTRASSRMAAVSSGMCSSTSEAITRSKVASAKGRASASPWTAVAGMAGGQLARLHHGAEGGPHLGHLVGTGVERHDRSAAAGRLERVPPETAPEVEHQVTGADAQPVVVDGQHRGRTSRRRRGRRGRVAWPTARRAAACPRGAPRNRRPSRRR